MSKNIIVAIDEVELDQAKQILNSLNSNKCIIKIGSVAFNSLGNDIINFAAKEGFEISLKIIPYLVAILVAIGMFRASGAMEQLIYFLTPILNIIGFPPENLPLAIMRPLSGSGSLGLFTDLVNQYGVDSIYTKIGATMFGSTETTFYVLAVYFGSVGIRKSRYALAAGLIADIVGILSAVYICKILFL